MSQQECRDRVLAFATTIRIRNTSRIDKHIIHLRLLLYREIEKITPQPTLTTDRAAHSDISNQLIYRALCDEQTQQWQCLRLTSAASL